MLGAIAGDIIGSNYESHAIKTTIFKLYSPQAYFTDDSVLTIAVADAILTGADYGAAIQDFARRHPHAGYGSFFRSWMFSSDPQPYKSFGNGSAMRVAPVGWAFNSPDAVLREAEHSAAVTHNHPEGIKGAQAVALAVYLARTGAEKHSIQTEITNRFGYELTRPLADIRPGYSFDVTCQGSVPQALRSFLESEDVESAIRNAVSLGGDADTQACMAGAVAEAFYGGLPAEMISFVQSKLPQDLWAVVVRFRNQYIPPD